MSVQILKRMVMVLNKGENIILSNVSKFETLTMLNSQ